MADAIQTLPNTKQDVILSIVQRELAAAAKLFPLVSDLSAFAGKGAKSIAVPKLSSFTVVDRAFGAAGDATALTDAKDTINLDFNAYVAWIEDKNDNYQSTIEYRIEAASRAAAAQGRYLDTQIANAIAAAAYGAVNGVAADVTKSAVIDMREALLLKNADMSKMVYLFSVDQESVLLDIADFVRADAYGTSNIGSGVIGRLYGVPVVVSNNLGGAQKGYILDKDGVGIALQQGLQMSEQMANEYGSQSMRVAMDQVFGVGGLQLGVTGVGATKSPLVYSLNP